jgi:hypothetical protein
MLVRFVVRNPGNHRTIGAFTMDAVPRSGEVVVINDIPRTVHEVSWDLNEDEPRAIVLLRS